jgi:hypothetical protein
MELRGYPIQVNMTNGNESQTMVASSDNLEACVAGASDAPKSVLK